MRILIVDDEPSLLMTLGANLELEGFEVVEAPNAAQALALFQQRPFDLVLSDIRMPGMNGVELYREIRRLKREVPVVLMTAFALEALVAQAIQEGVFTVLPKPFEIEHVIAALTTALRNPAVLIVDDVGRDAESTAETLRLANVHAEIALTADNAVSIVRSRSVDVCVVDLVMPDMNGADLMTRIRAIDPRMTFIAVSGYDVPDLMRRVAALGTFACMTKPFEPARLVETIARARGRRP